MISFFNENKTDQLITDLLTDGQTYWKNNAQMHNQGSEGTFPENMSLIRPAVQEMCGQVG